MSSVSPGQEKGGGDGLMHTDNPSHSEDQAVGQQAAVCECQDVTLYNVVIEY